MDNGFIFPYMMQTIKTLRKDKNGRVSRDYDYALTSSEEVWPGKSGESTLI
jgi:hypothetical protein